VTLLADRLDVLREIESIGEALDAIEERHGYDNAEIQDARHRQQRIRGVVLEQLRALLFADHTATVH
jgi:hypothetical protein